MFAGPTLARATLINPELPIDDIVVLPPVKRGDLPSVVQSAHEPGIAVIVDGYFHLENLAVGHLEIRVAMQRGWTVWGLSSMGAIRAAEMHHLGVRGWGRVFERYRDDPEFRDDEVALLHEPSPPYREGSEPLVHLREALQDLVATGRLTANDERVILEALMGQWFGDRSLASFRDLVRQHQRGGEGDLQEWWQGFNRFRRKAHDLISFVEQRPWEVTAPP